MDPAVVAFDHILEVETPHGDEPQREWVVEGNETKEMLCAEIPCAPVFLCDGDGDWMQLEKTVKTERTLFRLHSAREFEFTAYAADETKWTLRYTCPGVPIWTRLRHLFTVPKIVVPVQWISHDRYPVNELRAAFLQAVENDDDVLTQFVERNDLVGQLKAAEGFGDFVRIWDSLGADCG
ncbi:hypothetical protein [Paludibaculum fermentans]|uniref:hypothetical protein n=1 Tax=Paludibaculum fermentans TaxID=1473598 RepID=UPI003EBDB94A